MNIEETGNNLFQPVVPELLDQLANKTPSVSSLFSYSPHSSLNINLKLVDNTLILL